MIKKLIAETLKNKNIIMFLITIFYILGCCAFFNNNPISITLITTILMLILLNKNFVKPKHTLFLIAIFYFGFINCTFQIKTSNKLINYAPKECTITGQIKTIPNSGKPNKTQFYFKTNTLEYNGKTIEDINSTTFVTVNNIANSKILKVGNHYKIKGSLRKPFKAGNPYQFDYGKYLRNYDTYTVFYTEAKDITKLEFKPTFITIFLQNLNNLRDRIISTHASYLKSPNIEILGGIIFGDDAIAPPEDIKTSFINSGLLHILAASGMNVAFIYGFWYFAMRKLRVPFKITLISGIGMIILYALMTGLGASVIRASLMLIFILLGKLIDRDTHSVALLSMIALLMMIFNPAYLNDVGFQLSFLVTFGLLTTANVIFEKTKPLPQWLIGSILVPIVAQIWVVPLQMFYFNIMSLYSVFANILTVPFLSIISFLGFLSSVLAIFEPIANFVCKYADIILNYLLNIIVYISNFFANLPNSLINTFQPHFIQILMYYCAVLLITYLIKINFKNKKLLATVILIFLIIPALNIKIKNHNMELITFDVQNADAFLLKSPNNKYFLIDTGKSSYNQGKTQAEMVIAKYLKNSGIKEIESMIITHFDSDHSGGAIYLLNNFNIKNVYINSKTYDSELSKEIYNKLNTKKIKTHLASHNEEIYTENNFSIKTLRKEITKSDNENSIITLIKHNDINILMMGDAALQNINNLPDKIDILKVGHHGAKSVIDTNTLKSLNPDISIISTGPNSFGHPSIVTINQLKSTKILRTDKNNSIKISSNGNKYKVLTYNTKRKKYTIKTISKG